MDKCKIKRFKQTPIYAYGRKILDTKIAFKKENLLKRINKLRIRTIQLWEWDDDSKVDFIKELIVKLNKMNISSTEELALKKISLMLIKKIGIFYMIHFRFVKGKHKGLVIETLRNSANIFWKNRFRFQVCTGQDLIWCFRRGENL